VTNAAHSSFRLNQLQRQADDNRSMYESLLSRYRESIEQEGLAAPDTRLLSRAEIPEADILTRKKYVACTIGTPVRQTVAHTAHQVCVAESHYTANSAHFPARDTVTAVDGSEIDSHAPSRQPSRS
jgi:hypothetical protein